MAWQLKEALRRWYMPLRRQQPSPMVWMLGSKQVQMSGFEAAELREHQARLLGQAQYPGVQHSWSAVAALIEQVANIEERFIAVSASW